MKSSAQNVPEDTLLCSSSTKLVIDYFNTFIAEQSEIYNGAKYELYPPANKGAFYFLDKKLLCTQFDTLQWYLVYNSGITNMRFGS